MIGVLEIRARRAAGETLRSIAQEMGCCEVTVARKAWGSRNRPTIKNTDRSYVVHKTVVGKCSTDVSVMPISLSRNATYFEAA